MLNSKPVNSSDNLTEEELLLIQQEIEVLCKVQEQLKSQTKSVRIRLTNERQRARDLTSELVAARRDEDKAMLASDEAVSHALRDRQYAESQSLEKLLVRPYFARFIVEEEKDNGSTVNFEYRLGFSANPDCRIVDWRKAPISKLFYEYKEGDEYFEVIQGRERSGRIVLRNTVEIQNSELTQIQCSRGTFRYADGLWTRVSGGAGRSLSRAGRTSSSLLPDIAALISAEQFRAITEDAETAVLIQGIAGSGKTTVALHRLAWLLHEENSQFDSHECLVLMISQALKTYCSQLLPTLNVGGVPILTFHEWLESLIKKTIPSLVVGGDDGSIARPSTPTPAASIRVKHSFAVLTALEDLVLEGRAPAFNDDLLLWYFDCMDAVLADPGRILERDESRLLNAGVLAQIRQRTSENRELRALDKTDDALVVRLLQLRNRENYVSGLPDRYQHIVVDEVQDLSPPELAVVIDSVEKTRQLTLVGDTAQEVTSEGSFPGWEKMKSHWNFADESSRYIPLTVSHRSTLPIMKLADHILREQRVTNGRAGRVPIWFKCRTESQGIESIIQWLQTALERFPTDLTAVICPAPDVARYATSLLSPTFGSAVRLGDDNEFDFDAGIIVTDVRQAKGLEFLNVLVWNPSYQAYPQNRLGQNKLYVATTRAEENLSFVSWGKPSVLMPPVGSRLVRGIDLTIEDEDDD